MKNKNVEQMALAAAKFLDELDKMADEWVVKTNIKSISKAIANNPERIADMLHQAFVEGAYEAFCIAKEQQTNE